MPVNCLDQKSQDDLIHNFTQGTPIKDLAAHWGRSRQTIIRVLNDRGVDRKIHRRTVRPLLPAQDSLSLVPRPSISEVSARLQQLHPVECASGSGERVHSAPPLPASPGFPINTALIAIPAPSTAPWYRRLSEAVLKFLSSRTSSTA
jgi:hypothetical protein